MNEDVILKKQEIYRSAQAAIDKKIRSKMLSILPERLKNESLIKLPYSSILPKTVIKKMSLYQKLLLKNEVPKSNNNDFDNDVVFVKFENSIRSYVYVCRDGKRYSVNADAINKDTEIFKNKRLIYTIDDVKDLFLPAIRPNHDYQTVCNQMQFNVVIPILLPRNAMLNCAVYQKKLAADQCIEYHIDDPSFIAAKKLVVDDYGNYSFIFYMLSGEVYINSDSQQILKTMKRFYSYKTAYVSASDRAQAQRDEKEKEEKEKKEKQKKRRNDDGDGYSGGAGTGFKRKSSNSEYYYKKQQADPADDADEEVSVKLPPVPSKFSIFNELSEGK